ncbi:MAG: hypothetical protein KME16_11740 [Scytolyngbya sp. HA4215-MV1]|jgi:hypothetical protein|nr:hypothetical protein [Scytolyngbya sp. HA4215-MV1]
MAEVNDIRSLLTAKSRAKVAPRDSSLSGKRSLAADEAVSTTPPQQQRSTTEPISESTPESLPLQAELANLPKMGKRLAVHLEESVREKLMQICDRQDITPEIFFEAAFILLQDHPELLDEALENAKVRLAQRKRAGLMRRTVALMQKCEEKF